MTDYSKATKRHFYAIDYAALDEEKYIHRVGPTLKTNYE